MISAGGNTLVKDIYIIKRKKNILKISIHIYFKTLNFPFENSKPLKSKLEKVTRMILFSNLLVFQSLLFIVSVSKMMRKRRFVVMLMYNLRNQRK